MRIPNPYKTGDTRPPAWAEALLRTLLAPDDRESVSGDLLDEYRDRKLILPVTSVLSRAPVVFLLGSEKRPFRYGKIRYDGSVLSRRPLLTR